MVKNVFSKKALIVLATTVFMGMSAAHAGAADNNKWYMGLSFGGTEVDTDISGLTGTASLDEDDNGYKIFAGYNFTKFIGVEVFYADLGEASLEGNSGDRFTSDGDVYEFLVDNASMVAETTSFGCDVVFSLPLNEFSENAFVSRLTPFAKLGSHIWNIDQTVSGYGVSSLSSDDDGFDFIGGVGLNVDVNEYFAVRGEYEYLKADEEDLTFMSAGVVVKF